MLQHVDYRTSADTGEVDSASIAPVADGESAKQLIFRRPTENNRTRLEILRDTEREHLVLRDMIPAVMWNGGVIMFNGAKPTYSGVFTIASDLYISPFQTAGDGVGSSAPYIGSTKAALTLGTTGVDQLVITSVKKQFESSVIAKADANRISVEILHDAADSIVLEGASGDVNNIKITIVSGTTTVQQLVDLINNDATVNQYVVAAKEGTTPSGAAAPLWGPTQWGTDYGKRFLKGGMPGIVHKITAANLSAFFATSANGLQKGDSIAIWYDKMVDKTGVGGRVQSTAENGNTTIPTASIFNTRVNPEYIPGCVPICKCIDDDTLVFPDGTHVKRDTVSLLAAGAGPEYGSLSAPLGWARMGSGPVHNPPVLIRQALDNADGHIDAILDEVEAARNSSVFGAQASLDDRIEKVDGHARHFISVGPGGMYTDLQTALLAQGRTSVGGKGGLFLVRQGSYIINTPIVLDTHCEIVGVEENCVILIGTGTSYAITFAASLRGTKSRLDNFTIQSSSTHGAIVDVPGSYATLDNLLIQNSGTPVAVPAIRVSGANNTLRQIDLQLNNQKALQFTSTSSNIVAENITIFSSAANGFLVEGKRTRLTNVMFDSCQTINLKVESTASYVTVENIEITGSLGDSAATLYIAGKYITARDIYVDCEGACVALSVLSANCTLDNVNIGTLFGGYVALTVDGTRNTCRNITYGSGAAGRHLSMTGSNCVVENLEMVMTDVPASDNPLFFIQGINQVLRNAYITVSAGTIAGPLIHAYGSNVVLDNLTIDPLAAPLGFTTDIRAPILLQGDGGPVTLKNSTITGFKLPHGTSALPSTARLIGLSVAGTVDLDAAIIENVQVQGFAMVVSPSGNMNCNLCGKYSGSGDTGYFDINGLHVNAAGKSYNTGSSNIIANLIPKSKVRNCTCFGSSLFGGWLFTGGADDLSITNNRVKVGDWATLIYHVNAETSGYNAHRTTVDHNQLECVNTLAFNCPCVFGSTSSTTYDLVITNNVMRTGTTGASSMQINFAERFVVMNNIFDDDTIYTNGTANYVPAYANRGLYNVLA